MSKFDDLVTKLREIFQIDRPELDFGVYRILNARADEINDYLSNRLKERVAEALATGAAANVEAQKRELAETIRNLTTAGVDPDGAPKVKELRAAIAAAISGASEHENSVFSHLLTFFSRYYDKGDFISQRRYKGDTYAIPYAGEEVVLHWANKDQYYTKSGEAFSNYGFKLDEKSADADKPQSKAGRSVQFRLIAADTAKDNRKDNDKERRFALAEARTLTRIDDEGEPYDEEIVPISEEDGDLIIRFEYRSFPTKTKQEALVDQAVAAILTDDAVKARWQDLTNRAPTDKKPHRTMLEKHLTNYTQKNTADYFIHKDLGTFLRRELDFYIKNEVMHLDDVQYVESFAAIETNLRMIQCLRAIALDLIIFLASIEDFQKKLWLKKKFVVAAHYCVTLDRIPEKLYERIAANPAQWEQWHELGMRDSAEPGSADDLKADPYLMADSALFDAAFRADLLKTIPDLDASMDGLLVHGDNFQALTLLMERYRGKVKCVYIDPPYNTSASEIAYKNSYKHSSWATLIENRIALAKAIMRDDGVICATIDDVEVTNLTAIMQQGFGIQNIAATVPIRINPSGRPTEKGFALTHEYAIFATNSDAATIDKMPRTEEQLKRFNKKDEDGVFEYRNLRREGSNSDRKDGQRQFYPIFADLASKSVRIPKMEWIEESREWIIQEKPLDEEVAIWPVNNAGREKNWRWSEESVTNSRDQIIARTPNGGTPQVYFKYRPNQEGVTPLTFWSDKKYSATEYGTATLKKLFNVYDFSYPKSIHAVEDCISVSGLAKQSGTAMDFFAGSGTTGHAIVNLNRVDNLKRHYILAEQGPYFNTVLKPRMQKVVYSADWKSGKPTASETGISHAFKVLKIESYEDTLNNLMLKRDPAQAALLNKMSGDARDDYMMRYMLDVEARGSILSVEDFKHPFDYTLNIAVDSAGASEPCSIDLIETFNYLIGLTVKSIDIQINQGFATVEGTMPDGKRTLVLWRDCDLLDYDGLARLCEKLAINPGDSEYDIVYVNGDHNLPTYLQASEGNDQADKTLNIRQIEPAFLSAMFEVSDA